jgi:transposase InsO family protein
MGELGLSAHRSRHRTVTTQREQGAQVAANLLLQDVSADHPHHKWTTETTSMWTHEGWLDLAVVLDVFSRLVGGVGYGSQTGCTTGREGMGQGSGSPLPTSGIASSLRPWQDLQQ